ncbi:Carbonic anhydrase-related protein 10 [Folsomia candida]|uniref:Carbonic anhydrase-related protein 10 n=1 Tax=Folsomia candida TaxID=158441 RepID=A0A226E6A2_FOLCA|nr:Carbonic anhydrase-related protein 10 [Folsomia candida]
MSHHPCFLTPTTFPLVIFSRSGGGGGSNSSDLATVSGVLRNTGQTVVFTVEKGSSRVNMTGGPLAYRYQFEELYVHYGPEDVVGSEHMIQGISFPAELEGPVLLHSMHRTQGVILIEMFTFPTSGIFNFENSQEQHLEEKITIGKFLHPSRKKCSGRKEMSPGRGAGISSFKGSAELQLYGFNVELYSNLSDAQQKPNGVVAISIMIRVSDEEQSKSPNSELRILTSVLTQIRFRNQSAVIKTISLHGLLPETDYYMTYEGSTTHPGCWETVTWVIFNKPVYLSKQMLWALRQLRQGSRPETPKSHLLNVRPTQQMHHRTVRTNINFALAQAKKCPTMQSTTYYKANMWRPPL